MIGQLLAQTKQKGVLIHSITNYVTINDVANVLLACGGRPIMSEDIREVEEITSICQGLNINIGMLTEPTIASMHRAGKKATELNHVVVLDPVGMGASQLRSQTVYDLIHQIPFTAIRGNISELRAIATGTAVASGVDSAEGDEGKIDTLHDIVAFTQSLSHRLNTIIIATGINDVISYKDKTYIVKNGHPKMRDVTGTGCMLTAIIAAYIASNREYPVEAVVAAVCLMGVAGEIAFQHLQEGEGNATYRNRIIDAIDCMSAEQLEKGARYEEWK